VPRTRIQPRPASLSRLRPVETDGITEERDVDVRATRAKDAVAHFESGRHDDEQRDDEHTHDAAGEQREGRVERCEHQGGHRTDECGADKNPQGGAEPLAVGDCPDIGRCLLHYPHWVTETVDVPIIASDVPVYAHPGDAGADLVAAEAVRLEPGARAMVGTGVRIALPDGYVAFVVPRSGLAAKHGITVVNAPGTVDAGYRGEIQVILLNTDRDHAHEISIGDRIAQIIVMPVPRARFVPVEALPDSVRGEGGFGSTGFGGPA
jgi:dUTP pyrophosphatase